jgi:hypothetical protein
LRKWALNLNRGAILSTANVNRNWSVNGNNVANVDRYRNVDAGNTINVNRTVIATRSGEPRPLDITTPDEHW